jgi:hypothetical protein
VIENNLLPEIVAIIVLDFFSHVEAKMVLLCCVFVIQNSKSNSTQTCIDYQVNRATPSKIMPLPRFVLYVLSTGCD